MAILGIYVRFQGGNNPLYSKALISGLGKECASQASGPIAIGLDLDTPRVINLRG